MPSLIFNVTYGTSQTRFEATRELLTRFAEGTPWEWQCPSPMTVPGTTCSSPPGYRSRWWNDDSAVVAS